MNSLIHEMSKIPEKVLIAILILIIKNVAHLFCLFNQKLHKCVTQIYFTFLKLFLESQSQKCTFVPGRRLCYHIHVLNQSVGDSYLHFTS